MKILTIGTDRKWFEADSAVRMRGTVIASHLSEYYIIVYAKKTLGLSALHLGNVHVYPTQSDSRWGYLWDAYRLGKQIIPQHDFVRGDSAITAQDPFETGVVAYLLGKAFRLPFQIQIHTDFFEPNFSKTFLNRMRKIVSNFVLKRATRIRVVSRDIARQIQKQIPSRNPATIDVLPVFVDTDSIQKAPPKFSLKDRFPHFKFCILMISRLAPEKNIDIGIRAVAEVVQNFPHVGLVIAGSGPEEGRLKSLVKNLGIESNVAFIGWQNDAISCFKTVDVFVHTSSYEGYGMTIVEAAASGCPIITTSVGIAKDICVDGDNAFVCPIRNVDCLVGAISKLISDNTKRQLFKVAMQDTIKGIGMSIEEYALANASLLVKTAEAPLHRI